MDENDFENKPQKFLLIYISAALYALLLAVYFILKEIAAASGYEIRMTVGVIIMILIWVVPAVVLGIILVRYTKGLRAKEEHRSKQIVFTILSVLYICIAIITLWTAGIYGIFNMREESTMPDGNLCVSIPSYSETEVYYAEPVSVFFRKKFEWDDKRKAESLGKIYGVQFKTDNSDKTATRFIPDNFKTVKVRIYYC